ncbi:hypothetical protein JMF89_05525 [Clostridiaceae bacterium UIB06]|uniref:Uncharacterized protein n=1 Tax=Clostridium thailandense TaxID=2794346 RepID=A0A949U319_9CLOT|nr:hypothetical protein [Clostridium thailandense]MBV7275459.1 hypothetical protein [Clostridium thailandense]MCH5136680.1 hypothetical protein [Clostridiaceae bacterium UIB06]
MADKLIVSIDGIIVEGNFTEEEKEAIEQQKQNELLNPQIIVEPVDAEKVAMAEAIIDLEARLSVLENK